MDQYQKPGMNEEKVQPILAAFAQGQNLIGEKAAEALLKKGETPLLKARGESLLASSLFARGAYTKLQSLSFTHQGEEEREAIFQLLPFYANYKVKRGPMKKVQGESLLPNLLFFPAVVNGKPGRFLFDTGAMATVICQGFLPDDQPNEKKVAVKALNAFGETLENSHIRVIDQLDFAGLHFTNKACMVLPSKQLTFPLSAQEEITIDGIIGFDIIKAFAWRINTAKVTLQRLASGKKTEKPTLFCDFFPLATVTWNGSPQLFAFDTGANQSIVFYKGGEGEQVPAGEEAFFAAGGEKQGVVGWLTDQQVNIGGLEKTHVKAALMESQVAISYHFNPGGIIGMDLLQGERVEMDFPAQRLSLK